MQIDVKPRSTCSGIVARASSRSARRGCVGEAAARAADELELVEAAPGLRERPPHAVEVLVARAAERIPAVAVPHHATKQPVVDGARPEPQPHTFRAPGLGLEPDVLERVEPAGVGGRRRPPRGVPGYEVLVEQRPAVCERHPQRAVLGLVPADGGEDDEPSLGEDVERGEVLREEERVAERRDDRRRGEPQRRRRGRDRGEDDERARPRHRGVLVSRQRVVARVRHEAFRVGPRAQNDVLARHHGVETRVLGLLGHADERAEVARGA